MVLPEFLLRMFDCTCLKAVNSTWIQDRSTTRTCPNRTIAQLVNVTWNALSVSGDDDVSKALLDLLTNIWTDFLLITMNTFSCAFVVNTILLLTIEIIAFVTLETPLWLWPPVLHTSVEVCHLQMDFKGHRERAGCLETLPVSRFFSYKLVMAFAFYKSI